MVAASLKPRVAASEAARGARIHGSQLFRWRKEHCERVEPQRAPQLLPVEIVPQAAMAPVTEEPKAAPPRRRRKTGIIEIELGGGRRVRVDRLVDTEVLRRVFDLLGPR
ncbi:transposase [Amorphus sp. 3PC139-8]